MLATVVIAFSAAMPAGPIAASIERHAFDAADIDASNDAKAWRRLAKIPPATEIVIDTDASPIAGLIAAVDASAITVFDIDSCGLPRSARRNIERMLTEVPDLARRFPGGFTSGDVRVRANGVFVGAVRVCAIETFVRRVARDEIHVVRGRPTSRSSTVAVATAAGAGCLAGIVLESLALLECRGAGCGVGEFVFLVGIPIGAGLAAAAATQHTVEDVYYRRP